MNGYPTGVSTQALDLGSIASDYMRSAVEQKLQEIKENKVQVSENAKNVLKSMSITAIPEMSGKLRDEMNKKIESYRSDIVNRFRKNDGKLSFEDNAAIEQGYIDLTNEMNVKKNWLDKYNATQKILMNPSASKTYNVMGATADLSKVYTDFMSGKSTDDPALIPFKHVLPIDVDKQVFGYVKERVPFLDKTKTTTVKGGTQTTLETSDLENIKQNIRDSFKTNPQLVNLGYTPDQIEQYAEQKAPLYQQQILTTQPVKEKSTKAGGIGGLSKDAMDYTPKTVSILGKTYTGINVPTNVTQSPRSYVIPNAVNLTTGESNVSVPKDAELKFIDVDNNKILFEGKGGEAQRGGQTLFFPENMSPVKEKGQWQGGKTESDLQKDATKKSVLETAFARQYPDSKTPSEIKDVTLTKTDGGVTVSGTAIVKGKEMPVSTTYKTAKDESQVATYEVPLYENKEAVAVVMPKVSVRGVPLSEYFKKYERGEVKQAVQVPSYSKAFLLGQGYSEAQINKAVQSGKLKLK